jgi:hypothetical protein
MSVRTLPLLLLSIVAALAACENALDVRPEPAHEDDDLDSELRLGRDAIAAFTREGDRLTSPVLDVAEGANRVAVMLELQGTDDVVLLARGRDGDDVGPWVEVEWTFAEEGLRSGRALLQDAWPAVQIALPSTTGSSVQQLTFSGVFVDDDAAPTLDAEQPAAQPLAPALAFVGVEPRSSWGARPARCSSRDSAFTRMALHHTASRNTGNVAAMARQIQSYHMDGRGYCDAAYHFAVSQDGRILELRELPFRGGHTLNNNTGNIGVVFLGCFDPACGSDMPSPQLIEKGAGIVAMLSRLHGIPVDADRVRGHRDHSGAQTACPGAHLYARLEDIRSRARAILGATSTPPPSSSPVTPPPATGPTPSGCGTLTANTVLARGEARTSCDGRVTLAHQADGNVVVYDAARGGRAVWSTGTHGRATTGLIMQGDGNFVLYNGARALWASGTHGRPGSSLAVQDDGNVVIYAPGPRAVWSTQTNR